MATNLVSSSTSTFEENFYREYNKLNEKQKEAVDTLQGPVLVVAGPGTGKTQIISVRICNILLSSDDQVLPQNILCLTYTDNGAVSMRKRLLSMIGATAHQIKICTFHAFCNEVIQSNLDYFGKRNLEPISDLEQVELLEEILNELDLDHPLKKLKGNLTYDVERLKNLFNTMKSENWLPDFMYIKIQNYINELPTKEEFIYSRKYKNFNAGDPKQHLIDAEKEKMTLLKSAVDLFDVYLKKMQSKGRYDYQDMIQWVIKAFKENDNLLFPYKELYRYILVDEYQDTNGSQNEILKLLSDDPIDNFPNIFCVGDDDQSIYEFQGARIHNITEFKNKYEDKIKVIVLEENYRSTQAVLDVSKNLIQNNNIRLVNELENISKDLTAAKEERINSSIVPEVLVCNNISQEETIIASKIKNLIEKQNVLASEIAILYYKHSQAENLIRLFDKTGIPYQIRKKVNILEEILTRQLITILSFLEAENKKPGKHNDAMLFEIMHYRFLNIHPHDIVHIANYVNEKEISFFDCLTEKSHLNKIKLKDVTSIEKFKSYIYEWTLDISNLTLQMLLEKIINESSLLAYILKHDDKINLMQELNTFFDFVQSESNKKSRLTIYQLLNMIEQMQSHGITLSINKSVYQEAGVVFSTCHGAKGSEYKYVFFIGCTKDKWESAGGNNKKFSLPDTITYSNKDNNLESQRRLFYVAVTRAKEYLYISYAENSNEQKALTASQFLDECKLTPIPQVVTNESLLQYQESLLTYKRASIKLPEKDFINEQLKNFVMSASTFNKYIKCPISFYFDVIVKTPTAKNDSMSYGTAIHYALEQLFKRMKSNNEEFPSLKEFINYFESSMRRSKDSFTEKQFENRLQLGLKQLKEYYENYINIWNRKVIVESWIGPYEVNGVPIRGKVDKIEINGDEIIVVDYKTGSIENAREKLKEPDEKNPDGGEYWRQMYFYKILMDANRVKKEWSMNAGEFDFIEKDKKDKFRIEKILIVPDELKKVKNKLLQVYTSILAHDFNTGCEDADCRWCNFVKDNQISIQ
jgi:DNA helicase-2/ATP-dependent DNA helicase PcrA